MLEQTNPINPQKTHCKYIFQVDSNKLEYSPSMKVETVLKFDDSQTFIAGDIADAATGNGVKEEERGEKAF